MELKQIKADLEAYFDNPGKYIDIFQHITLAYKLTWKDTMIVLGEILSDLEQKKKS